MNPIKVGLLGVGTVGSGTFAVLKRNQAEISRRAGRDIVVTMIADRDLEKARALADDNIHVTDDAFAVVADPGIEIVVELIGGVTVAKDLILKAIENGKHVVTANKALLASYGTEIFAAAREKGVIVELTFDGRLAFAVAVKQPVIAALHF
jgi:homoserine dehydrogenase